MASAFRRKKELELGSWELSAEGGIRFNGAAATLYAELDAEFEHLARDAGAQVMAVEPVIARRTLARAGFFDAFSDRAVPAEDPDAVIAPAACYHVYDALAGRRLQQGAVITLAAPCARREKRDAADAGRLEHFRMREIVFLGGAEWVSTQRDDWINRASTIATSRGLAGTLEPATDMFFGDTGRGRRLIQQLKQLKIELRVDVGTFGSLAIASFNLHESFFTSRFGIAMADGSPAVSGCVAFGLERWTLACLALG